MLWFTFEKIKEHNSKREFLVHRLSVMMQIGFITFDLVFWIFCNLKYCRNSFIANVISVIFVWICFQPVPNLENFEKFSVSLSEFAGLEMRHKKVEVSFELRNSLMEAQLSQVVLTTRQFHYPDDDSISGIIWIDNTRKPSSIYSSTEYVFFFQWKTK